MNTFIKYWSYLVENEDKEISFETFLKEKSNLFEATKKWPEDYLKQAKNLILNSPLGKSSWYSENLIDQDLQVFKDEFDTLAHKGSFALGFFPSIIKWFIEYSGSDKQKYQEFIEGKLDKIIGILNYIVNQKDDEVSQFHGISKEKDKDGNPLILKFKKLKEMNWSDFDKNVFQKYSDQISKSVELDKDSLKKSDYEAIPIYSYEELNKKFGGNKTGYKGRSEWCHTNGRSTYDSWTKNGRYMFIVFAKKGWENIVPPDPKTTNAFDNYGTSLIACLFDTGSKELLNSTLRWNHIIDPAKTKIGASVDHAFKNNNDLMNTVGIDLSKDLDEYFKKIKEKNRLNFVTIGGEDFKIENGNINCASNYLTSLKGSPQKVNGNFNCNDNKLTSLKGAPQEVGGDFECKYNNITSLEGGPQKVGRDFWCTDNQLTSLKGAPQKVGGYFSCEKNKLTSLEGVPEYVGGDFWCNSNQLTSLEGAPKYVGGHFSCAGNKDLPEYKVDAYFAYLKLSDSEKAPLTKDNHYYPTEEWENKFREIRKEKYIIIGGKEFVKNNRNIDCSNGELTSLEGAPEYVEGYFTCKRNRLTSLEGAPQEVGRDFSCADNHLRSLEGAPYAVGGRFICSNNYLSSLEGAPENVGEDFYCSHNQLTSLVGGPITSFDDAPLHFYGSYYCYNNKLTSLEGAPPFVDGDFTCEKNKLTSLEGAPEQVGSSFSCEDNQLTSLAGAPEYVGNYFNCQNNQLTSLEGAPQEVDGSFSCSENKLTSLKGCPQKIGGIFNCRDNKLTSLVGAPQEVGRDFDCCYNPLTSLEGAPQKIGGRFEYLAGFYHELPRYKVDAYRAYLRLSDSEKAPLTKDNHYYPTEEWENKFK